MMLRYGTPREAGMSSEKLKKVEKMIRDYVNAGKTHAFVILAARKGIITMHLAVGTLSHEKDSPPLETDTIFPMSSITKPVTATAAMILYEAGKLDINKPIVDYVPEFIGEDKEKALVHQLMTHTTGMNEDAIWDWWEENKVKVATPSLAENQNPYILRYLYPGLVAPLWKHPGAEMSYCTWGIELLAEIIHRVSGQSFESFVRERIFQPLGMKDSFLIVPQTVRDRIIRRPKELGADWYASQEALETPYAGGGLFSTAYDMAVFGQMFLNKGTYGNVRIISPDTVKEMTRNQIPGLCSHFFDEYFEEAGWGYCWDIPYGKNTMGSLVSQEAFTHGGASGVMILADPYYNLFWATFFVDYSTKKAPFTFPGEVSDALIQAIES